MTSTQSKPKTDGPSTVKCVDCGTSFKIPYAPSDASQIRCYDCGAKRRFAKRA